MSEPIARLVPADQPAAHKQEKTPVESKQHRLIPSIWSYAWLGACASCLLSAIELVDLNFQLTPVFRSFSSRLIFASYFSVNLFVGFVVGALVGLATLVASVVTSLVAKVVARGREPRTPQGWIAALAVSGAAGVLLVQQPHVYGYVLGLIREAEKISLAGPLLRLERIATYLTAISLLIGCSLAWKLSRASAVWRPLARSLWIAALIAILGAAYYVDSRVEVQQYEYSLHRSMFLLDIVVSMALIGSVQLARSRSKREQSATPPPTNKLIPITALLVIAAGAAFTFIHFDQDQNLKIQLFSRTTQAKQHFKLVQWALDFDRDGYSPYLGGGDSNDHRADINPGATEIVGDGTDNNDLGGDLTQQALDDWNRDVASRNSVPNPAGHRYNVIYIFIDTLRADHLGVYGYPRNTSPNIDKLAGRSFLFEHAYTPSPSTFQAVPKFMQSSFWNAGIESWPEVLVRNGYQTILFPGRREGTLRRRIQDPNVLRTSRTKNVKETVDAAIDILGGLSRDKPFCAYLYSVEPHRPYKQRSDFYFGPSLTDLYDGEIAFSDFHYGRLFDWLEQTGRMNDTMIILMSDHGESLGERGVYKHNAQLYDEQMRVPTVFYVPNHTPRRVPDYASTIDLGSTILNLVGVEVPKEYHGTSLVPLVEGLPFVPPPVYCEHILRNDSPFLGPEKTIDPEVRKYSVITQDGYKLIYNRNYYGFELFNLKEDPREENNLYDAMPERSAEMKKVLGRFVDIMSMRSAAPSGDIWLAPAKGEQ